MILACSPGSPSRHEPLSQFGRKISNLRTQHFQYVCVIPWGREELEAGIARSRCCFSFSLRYGSEGTAVTVRQLPRDGFGFHVCRYLCFSGLSGSVVLSL